MMDIKGKRIVLTGATGGIGRELAHTLAERGAELILIARNKNRLDKLVQNLVGQHDYLIADLNIPADIEKIVLSKAFSKPIDALINNAGINEFSSLSSQSYEQIQKILNVNLLAPMIITKALLPLLLNRPEAVILNIGSTFGSIGFPGNTGYCASKFGLRGFTEALRREIIDSKVKVHYLSPRATKTSMNTSNVDSLNLALRNSVDEPRVVISAVLKLMSAKHGRDLFIGWPEKLFVKVNALFPSVVSQSITKKLATIRQYTYHSHTG